MKQTKQQYVNGKTKLLTQLNENFMNEDKDASTAVNHLQLMEKAVSLSSSHKRLQAPALMYRHKQSKLAL